MLFGTKVVLRAWREADLEVLTTLRNDVDLQAQLMSRPRPNSLERVRKWLLDKSGSDDAVFFVIADAINDAAVGYIQVMNLSGMHGCGDFGICLAPAAHGRGFASESLVLLETYLRDTFDLRKLMLQVLEGNARAREVYERSGFREIGRLESHFYLGKKFHDVIMMEKLLRK